MKFHEQYTMQLFINGINNKREILLIKKLHSKFSILI